MLAPVLFALAAVASAPAPAEPAPPRCEWRAADPAFEENRYLVCRNNAGKELVAQLVDVRGYPEKTFSPRIYADALAGDPAAMRVTGDFYLYYLGDLQDPRLAVDWYRKAAPGDATAKLMLAVLTALGKGVERDANAAAILYREAARMAADNRDTYAMVAIGMRFEGDDAEVRRDDEEALRWFRPAAQAGDRRAMLHLAQFYARPGPYADAGEARRLLKAAALSDDAYVILSAAGVYDIGADALRDEPEALRLYSKAAALGATGAMRRLADYSKSGAPKDDAQAARWYEAAARRGSEDAMDKLAEAYRLGLGVAKDAAEAESWTKAAKARRLQRFDISQSGAITVSRRPPPAQH